MPRLRRVNDWSVSKLDWIRKSDVIALVDKVDAAVRQMELHPDQRIAG
jgi:hypothetical protein